MTRNTRLPSQSYPPLAAHVNGGRLDVWRRAAFAVLLNALAVSTAAQPPPVQPADCASDLTTIFAPAAIDTAAPYRVCRTPLPLEAVRLQIAPFPWPVERHGAHDVFAGAPPAVRRAAGLLYGGRMLEVARGWRHRPPYVESVTLVAPAPDDRLQRIAGGTLIIVQRWRDRSAPVP